ncbi:TPA: molecular chaperone GroEL [Legionella pneumophila]
MSYVSMQFQEEACLSLLAGSKTLTDAVKITFGPKGRHVVYENEQKQPVVTKDGVTVAKMITLGNAFEDAGAQIIREAALKTANEAGDGTTTTILLAQSLLSSCMKYILTGDNPQQIQMGLESASEKIMAYLKKTARLYDEPEEKFAMFENVATIATNGDKTLGQLIAEAFTKAGDDGYVTYEEGNGIHDELKFIHGWQFGNGYLSPYFVTNSKTQRAELNDPLVLLVNEKITSVYPLLPLLEQCQKANKSLLIIADDISDDALNLLVVNQIQGTLKSVAVKAPGFGTQRQGYLDDLALLTGAEVISKETGKDLDQITLNQLGKINRCLMTRTETILIGNPASDALIQTRIFQLKQKLSTASKHERQEYEQRLSKLSGKTAILCLSASSELEIHEKKARVEDAIHAVRAAKEEGVVPGGGMALFYAQQVLTDLQGNNPTQQKGIKAMQAALTVPLKQLVLNGGQEPPAIINQLYRQNYMGYDVSTRSYCNMFQVGIVDPLKVVRLSLTHALSVVNALLSTGAIIVKINESNRGC